MALQIEAKGSFSRFGETPILFLTVLEALASVFTLNLSFLLYTYVEYENTWKLLVQTLFAAKDFGHSLFGIFNDLALSKRMGLTLMD